MRSRVAVDIFGLPRSESETVIRQTPAADAMSRKPTRGFGCERGDFIEVGSEQNASSPAVKLNEQGPTRACTPRRGCKCYQPALQKNWHWRNAWFFLA